ncbi:MAG: 5'/3'-nucleotidase SurE [Armatimonadetes bacterium CG_4_10_14_3_um_filter_66_18]|nr:5'/3'-nucleotidase SurE [Armatimonadota bacterium]PIU92192.1 MAG: 5'/3'-nucleotidase SurE [Armatimonadetes bacterium CG06_land_8_20_14_3_00_66_21]PIX46442.1 MAG: 5'/3'-nucleotidase SurE [Armatimonadetes bacterium CG_4_8_14_3_um_filter_66_20]PIY54447.1 MAG: 5'/3'-nucleotidase SurE [Armatimonadetes bacterium CG_4_10_14_3_um_filter_66_18]PIZ34390.1 MAG: 5'/3'-nucleotidase SurE [Armatimonadetes bacterium CG_4_10_14_0_8_um_filter_66_14]PJB60087.1 MAG: 5'/3'-nucleotidase SurE [Armatimonadetes bac
MGDKLQVLVTNDDGPHAPALALMREAFSLFADVVVVVPERPRSACGHAVTLHKPLRLNEHKGTDGSSLFTCNGFPSDCVTLGAEHLCSRTPDVVVSGINQGANLGDDVTYSGTVAGAMEAIVFGMKGFSISVTAHEDPRVDVAVPFAARLVRLIAERGLPERTLLNVNVPNCAPADVQGVVLTRLGRRSYRGSAEKRTEPRGGVYYWRSGHLPDFQADPGTDLAAIAENKISVTPLSLDLTAVEAFGEFAAWELGWTELPADLP